MKVLKEKTLTTKEILVIQKLQKDSLIERNIPDKPLNPAQKSGGYQEAEIFCTGFNGNACSSKQGN
jgi:hypothetical protein